MIFFSFTVLIEYVVDACVECSRQVAAMCVSCVGGDGTAGGAGGEGGQDIEASRVLSDNLHEASREQSLIDSLSGSVCW